MSKQAQRRAAPDRLLADRHGDNAARRGQQQPVLVVMGVSGSGKSTVAGILGARLGWDVQEGDDLHPAANIAKMAAGQPLTDDDRWPWLDRVAAWVHGHASSGTPGIITCSALKRTYRDRIRGQHVVFVHLAGSRDRIDRQIASRSGHFMPAALLDSQLATLEPPAADENVLVVDVRHGVEEAAAEIISRLQLVAAQRVPMQAAHGEPVLLAAPAR